MTGHHDRERAGASGNGANGAAELERLAAELDGETFEARVITPPGRRPRLHVRSRGAAVLAEDIYCDGASYWFGWAEKIAPVSEVAAAARVIGQVLRRGGGGG
jgi:hypothetical protein